MNTLAWLTRCLDLRRFQVWKECKTNIKNQTSILTKAFAKSPIFFISSATLTGSMFFKSSNASRSPMVMHANFFPSNLVPSCERPLPTTKACLARPAMFDTAVPNMSPMASPVRIASHFD